MIWYMYVYMYIYVHMIYVFGSLVHNFAPNPPNICVCATELLSSKFLNLCKTKEEQIPGPVLWELYTAPWWLQWNLHKKLRYFFETFLASSCKRVSTFTSPFPLQKQMFHRRVEISTVLIPGTFQLGWKAAIWRTSSQILCTGQDVRGGGGADLCASTQVVIWRWTLDSIKVQKFDES